MIPLLYEKDGINKIGELSNCIECLVEEERNGLFELTIVYPTTDEIFNSLEEENIIVCNANDTLKNQKFRIYMTKKLMSNRIEVYARHISFDLAYDRVDSINITNQSCEYSLNAIFKQSQFSTHYRGHSDIINAQNYTIANVNCIEAIAGKEGSIIDTYGTGAEILRDNTNIHVLNRRGNDNEVKIEYAKNLTGFELEEDFSELVTRINASAKYTNSETNESHVVEAKGIDSPLISNYSHPYIAHFDYSDKFEEGETPTSEKLIALAKKEFSVNNKDKPKQNFKIEFIPLSKCVGYEDLEDKISLCDTVTIIDTRYNINTKAKVIRVVFNVLKDRYESMELGEPRTTLGDIIGPGGNVSDAEDTPTTGPQGPPGQDGTNGVDGVDAIYVNLTNDSHVVPTLSDGTGGNYTGCETVIELYKGADKINFGVSYEAEQIEGVTASLKGNVYSITNMTVDNCNVGLRATYNSKTYLKYFNVSKSKKGVDGTDGVTYYTWIRYADDDKGNGISNDPTGKEYIGFAYNKLTPIESNVPSDYTWSLIKGTDGVPGQNGSDGTTYYTWIKYSDYADGNPCYELPNSNTKYIGIATNKLSPNESDDYRDYKWSKFRGDDGVDGTDGKDAYTINISNDSHVFASESDGRISREQTTSTKVVAFKGTSTVPFTIGSLPNVSGLRLSKDSTTVTITALTGSSLADSGSFEIPITVEGLTFKKVFSWSKAKKGVDGSLGDFPDTLPTTPTLEYKVYGFANIELSWTYENKTYYSYELYASKTRNFNPNSFDLIHAGQSSSFLFQARPNETWYFKVCAINSHGRRTSFSNQVEVTTRKINDLSSYVENAAIGDALIGQLNLGRGWFGQLRGNYIDAKQLSVTDGNGKRTWDIDSFGNVYGDMTALSLNSVDVEESINREGNMIPNSNFLYDIEGYKALGGSISHYSYEKPKEDTPADIPADNKPIPSKPNDTITGIPSGGNTTVTTPPVSNVKPPVVIPISSTRIHFLLTPSCGDCILIQCDNGTNILIDGPDDRLIDPSYTDNTLFIEDYFKKIGISHLDYVICTHFHSDHAGALPYLIDNFCDNSSVFMYKDVDSVKLAQNSKEVSWKTQQYRDNCISTVNSLGMTLKQPSNAEKLTIDANTSLTFYKSSSSDYTDYNSQSLVVVFQYKNKKVLLLGDIPKTVQQELYSSFGRVDILKDSHHGYNQSISLDLCRNCGCKDVIVTRNHGFDTDYYRACNSTGIWQSYSKNIYTLHNTNNHIIVDFINNDYTISTGKRFYFENCWLKIEDKWCYFKQGGLYAKNESLTLENKTYDFNINGYCTNPYNPR